MCLSDLLNKYNYVSVNAKTKKKKRKKRNRLDGNGTPILWRLGSENQWEEAFCWLYCCPFCYCCLQPPLCMICVTHYLELEAASVPPLSSSDSISHCTPTTTSSVLLKPVSPGGLFLGLGLVVWLKLMHYDHTHKFKIPKNKNNNKDIINLACINFFFQNSPTCVCVYAVLT